ncbi:MAG: SMI1/KNR4 family protein [Armatimonadetes bacterium]|nr:SMI1/KNR4 family protein [Armatimonadota bacterium]
MPYPATEEMVQAAEHALGRRLPDDFRNRLLRDNGGEVKAAGDYWTLFPVWDPGNRRTMRKTCNHIVRESGLAHQKAGFPVGAIAIAANGCGDHLIIRAGSDDVEFWDHETGESRRVRVRWKEEQ